MKGVYAAEADLDYAYMEYKKNPCKDTFNNLVKQSGLYKAKVEAKKEEQAIWLRQS